MMGLFSKKSSDSVKEAADAVRKLSMSDAKKAAAPAEPAPAAAEAAKEEKGKSLGRSSCRALLLADKQPSPRPLRRVSLTLACPAPPRVYWS